MTISTLPTYMLDTATMLRRWRIQRAVTIMQEARRQADVEVATIAHLPTIEMPTRQLQRLVEASRAVVKRPPPHLVGAVVALLLVLAGVLLGNQYRVVAARGYDVGSTPSTVDGGASVSASSLTEWRDDSVVEAVSK